MAQTNGGMFKAQVPFAPYFYLQAKVRPHPLLCPPACAATPAAPSVYQRPSIRHGLLRNQRNLPTLQLIASVDLGTGA